MTHATCSPPPPPPPPPSRSNCDVAEGGRWFSCWYMLSNVSIHIFNFSEQNIFPSMHQFRQPLLTRWFRVISLEVLEAIPCYTDVKRKILSPVNRHISNLICMYFQIYLIAHKWQYHGLTCYHGACWWPTHRAKFMGPTWGPSGSCRPQMGPMLAPWILLSGLHHEYSGICRHIDDHV